MKPEFSRLFSLDEANDDSVTRSFKPTDAELKALAKRFDFDELKDVSADFVIDQLEKGTLYHVKLALKATAIMRATPKSEPVTVTIDAAEEDLYTTRKDLIDEDDLYSPELVENGQIDLGEMASDYLFLMVDERFKFMMEEIALEALLEQPKPEDTHRPFANLKDMLEKKS